MDFPAVQVVQTVQKTVGIPVDLTMMTKRQVPAQDAQKSVEGAQVQFLDKIADVPVPVQRQLPMVQKMQTTVSLADVPTNMRRQVSMIVQAGQKFVEDAQAQFTDRVMNVSVGQQSQTHMAQTVEIDEEMSQERSLDEFADVTAAQRRARREHQRRDRESGGRRIQVSGPDPRVLVHFFLR